MSVDIYLDSNGILQKADTDVYKGANILKIQVGTLVYAPDLGIDLESFLTDDVKIQPETFKSYSTQQLVGQGVRASDIASLEQTLDTLLDYTIDSTQQEGGSL